MESHAKVLLKFKGSAPAALESKLFNLEARFFRASIFNRRTCSETGIIHSFHVSQALLFAKETLIVLALEFSFPLLHVHHSSNGMRVTPPFTANIESGKLHQFMFYSISRHQLETHETQLRNKPLEP